MDGVILTQLKQVQNTKGDILHVLRKSDAGFQNFGEVYCSEVVKGAVKGWKKHKKMTLNIVVPVGKILFTIYDDQCKEFFRVTLSRENYQRLTIKPGLWVAFSGIDNINMLINVASIEHNPSESENKPLCDIEYELQD